MLELGTRGTFAVVLVSLLSAIAFGALMQHSETTVAVPAAGEKVTFERLQYKARFVASVDSLTLKMKSEAGADPVFLEWVFTGSNTDGQAHRVEIVVRLLDEAGTQIGLWSTRRILAPGARGLEITLETKVKGDVWKAAKKVRIFADWIT